MTTPVQRLVAFTAEGRGGNPAGVAILESFPPDSEMQRLATKMGYSETVFAVPEGGRWRVRYFAPKGEVNFCGHATIALGAALGARIGGGTYRLQLNEGEAEVTAHPDGTVSLVSPPTRSKAVPDTHLAAVLDAFGLRQEELDPTVPPRLVMAGARHLLLALRDRERLATMSYAFEVMRDFMRREDIATIALAWRESYQLWHVRNAFAFGDVFEDPATGAAAAALAGYLRELGELAFEGNVARLTILQGEDMQQPCALHVEASPERGAPVTVSGTVGVVES